MWKLNVISRSVGLLRGYKFNRTIQSFIAASFCSNDAETCPMSLQDDDYFGIQHFEQGKTVEPSDISDGSRAAMASQKEDILKEENPSSTSYKSKTQKPKKESVDKVFETKFGLMRLDGRKDGNKKSNISVRNGDRHVGEDVPQSSGSEFIDEQFFHYEDKIQPEKKMDPIGHPPKPSFGSSDSHLNVQLDFKLPRLQLQTELSHSQEDVKSNVFDEQYFECSVNEVDSVKESTSESHSRDSTVTLSKTKEELHGSDVNLFDQQMFGVEHVESDKPAIYSVTEDMENQFDKATFKESTVEGDHPENMEVEFHEPITQRKKRSRLLPVANVENPQTAYDMAMKIRTELAGRQIKPAASDPQGERTVGDVDSKGFRILKNQVPDFSRTPEMLMVKILKDSIIYNDNDIVAIDKPYGIASQGGPGVRHNITSLLPQLARKIDPSLDTLHQIHRLDKETTGVMIFAKTDHMKHRLRGMFRDREIIKKYWVITKGIPTPPTGLIEIPMAEGEIAGAYRMVLKPEYNEDTRLVMRKSQIDTADAVTKYRVLDSRHDAALIQCEPQTGVKHQIRCHLAFGLNTPILGDHKYSHFTKLAPQRLYPSMLQKLGIRQSKVRHVPMHLHAKSIIIPHILDGRYLHLSTHLPKHFVTNMKRLQLKPPK